MVPAANEMDLTLHLCVTAQRWHLTSITLHKLVEIGFFLEVRCIELTHITTLEDQSSILPFLCHFLRHFFLPFSHISKLSCLFSSICSFLTLFLPICPYHVSLLNIFHEGIMGYTQCTIKYYTRLWCLTGSVR